MEKLEKMADFFAARIDDYDEHMLRDVPGCRNGYKKMAQLIPSHTRSILDLGCGTGLELDEIFKLYSETDVTGIDLCPQMLERLKKKHPDKKLSLVCDDYFRIELPASAYDCAVSFQTMHHFYPEDKLGLYKKILNSLTQQGIYIECDYMVETYQQQELLFAESLRLRKSLGIGEREYYHYDTPCCIQTQKELLKSAGFREVSLVFREENTTILVAKKQ